MRRILALLLAAETSAVTFHVSNVYGNHMVLQRDAAATVFGFANPGVTVTATLDSTTLPAVTTDANNTWRVVLPNQPGSATPHSLSFKSSDGGSASLSDILFGDVHICSGQSNMQFTLLTNAGVPNVTAELAAANNYPLLRVFTVGQGNSSTVPFVELASIEQPWAVASNLSIGVGAWSAFSGVCWFTYRDVFNGLGGGIPQGLISNNWGGTPIQHWSSPAALAACNGGTDSTLWNAMVVPYTVGPMRIRTAIWYQGESNVGATQYYDCAMQAMIADWRAKLTGLRTFGIVQIAAYTGYANDAGADMRQAQLSPLRSMNNIAFTTAIDGVVPWSSLGDIHPTNKQLIGARLANQILAVEYGLDTPHVYPFYAGAAASVAGTTATVTVTLSGCIGGCIVNPSSVPTGINPNLTAGYAILTNDKAATWWNATAVPTADGQGLVLTANVGVNGLSVVATAYGRATVPIVTGYNSLGLPVMPWCFTLTDIACYNAGLMTSDSSVATVAPYDGVMADYAA